MPRKPRKSKGRKPRAKKTSRTFIPSDTRAAVTALENSGVSYAQIKMETGVNMSTAHQIVQRTKRLASENRRPLLAPENFHDDRSHNHWPKALT
jgi:hypothetical protein